MFRNPLAASLCALLLLVAAAAVIGLVTLWQIVATLVGSIGLIAAVPLTTALAALLATQLRPDALAEDGPAHVH